jgi:UDP-N-acetylglucosamine 2-epimerase
MGERPDTILCTGCPSSDIARLLDRSLSATIVNGTGNGTAIDVTQPYLLVLFHPTTTEYGGERAQMDALLGALDELATQTVLLWPNIDAGSDHISKAIRIFRNERQPSWLRTLTNLLPEEYLKVLSNAACAIGNSSSFVRDAGYFGTPVVLVGNRQDGREADAHVIRVKPVKADIERTAREQIRHGRYLPSELYGDGHVAERVASAVAYLDPYVQKKLQYVFERSTAAAAD